jgi:hypothetical protein
MLDDDYAARVRVSCTYGRARSSSLAVVVALVVSACGATAPTPSGSAPLASGSPPATLPTSTPGVGETSQPVLAGPSRSSLINQAVADGTLDPVTGLLYRAYGLFGLPGLPDEFAAGVPRADDGLFAEMVEMMPTLSAADQAKLRPFVVRPTDPDSIFAAAPAAIAGIGPIAQAPATGATCRDWAESGAADPRFKIWACRDRDTAAAAADIATIAAILGQIWGPMTEDEPAGMGPPLPDGYGTNISPEYGGDARIDFYALDLGQILYRDGNNTIPITAAAAASPSPPYTTADGAPRNSSSGFVLVNRGRIGEPVAMKQDLVHEFFHVLQHAHNRRGPTKGDDSHWFSEASAVWAETYYVPSNSKVPHAWFPDFFQPSGAGLEDPDADHENAAYIWPFFMQQEKGASAVFQAWTAIEPVSTGDFPGVTEAISSQLSFDTAFRDFAVRNLNLNDVLQSAGLKRYKDLDGNFYDDKPPATIGTGGLSTKAAYTSPEQSLKPLAAAYFLLTPDADAHEVTFDLTTLSSRQTLDGDVLLHINQKWERRPIENGVLRLCRDEPADAFDQAYLILSNHGRAPADKIIGQFEIRSKTACSLGHYSIDVANANGGTHKGAGHHEADGQVICSRTPDGSWVAYGVYFPNDPDVPERDIADFHITTTPSHEFVEMTLTDHTSDSPNDWAVIAGFSNPTFSFVVDDQSRPVTVTASAEDHSQTIKIVATCSVLNLAP